jgi:hypothetical protein
MRDLITKLEVSLFETTLNSDNPAEDYNAKKKALYNLETDPVIIKEPELMKAVQQRKADLEKEAELKGVGKMHKSPSGKMTNMSPKDDDYEINYGKGAAK